MKIALNSFNGGEVTPLLEGRLDLPSLLRSCRKLRNFMPLATGAAVRRPSLLHVATALDWQAAACEHIKLIPFVYDTATRYIVGISASAAYPSISATINVWRSDGTLAFNGPLNPSDGFAYPDGYIFDPDAITHAQVNDILFIAHPKIPPFAIFRLTDTTWKVSLVGSGLGDADTPKANRAAWPAVLDENITEFTTTDAVEGWTIAMVFAATGSRIVGGIFSGVTEGTAAGQVTNGPCPAFWRLYTGTTAFVGTIAIQVADTFDAATWRTIYTVTNASTGALTLRQEWYHHAPYMRLLVTRSSGTATLELRHLGSTAAPTMWVSRTTIDAVLSDNLFSSPPAFNGWKKHEAVQLAWQRLKQQVEVTTAATGTDEFPVSSELYVLGGWELYTTGTWTGSVYVETKESTGNWRIVRHLTSKNDKNWSISGTSTGETLRVRVDKDTASSVARYVLGATDGVSSAWLTLAGDGTAPYSAKQTATLMPGIDLALAAQATTAVSLAAFSPTQGYPASVVIHDQRVYYAGTTKRPTTVWASGVNDLFNFRRTGLDDGGFMFELASNQGNPIQWMLSASRGILCGTSGDEWLLDGADTGITPTNITARKQSGIGSHSVQAMAAAGAILFLQRGAMHLQEYQFAWESQQFDSVDLTELVKHLTAGDSIRCIAFSQNPEPTIYAVTANGWLLTCAYNRKQEVIAWAQHLTTGTFESVAVTYGDTGNADDVWFMVARNGARRLEKLDPVFWVSLYNGGRLFHADGAVVQANDTPFTSVTGCAHLNGHTASVMANGVQLADVTVSGGAVTVPSGTTHAVVGMKQVGYLQPMPFDLPLMTGTTQGRKMHEPTVAIRLYRSLAGKYADSATSTKFAMKITEEKTGILRLAMQAAMRDSNEVFFETTGMLPLNIVAVIPSVNPYGE